MTGKNQIILIVDDRPANLIALDALLSSDSRLLVTAHSAQEALQVLAAQEVDLILLDVQMPETNGFELAQIIKGRPETAGIPILFVSAEKVDYASLMKGFAEGAVDYLLKPLDAGITRAKVKVLLELQRQKKELMEKNALIRRLNASLGKTVQQLEVANKELESFSYSVSHDLRAPLRAVYGNAEIMDEDFSSELSDGARMCLRKIKDNATRMNTLIDDLLAFSRISKKELHKSTVNMGELVRDVFASVAEEQLRAKVEIHPMPDAVGDYTMLQQVWTNLISNAIKYSSKKEDPLIEVGAVETNGTVEYYVKDNGAGFDMAYAGKLFGTFQRLHDVTEFEGTGIGLAIVQRIVLKHGGAIRAEAELEKGACFRFTVGGA